MKVKLLLTAITLSCLAIDVLAQVSISGKIVSADTNEPVVGANIRIDQSLSGCTTNDKGEFSISNLPDGKHVLRITHVSYTPKSITTKGGEKNLLIKLQDSFTNIGQVVVTGTGTHHRMTDSPVPVSVITAKDLSNASVTSLDEALQKLTPSFSSMTNGMGTTLSLNGLPDDYFIFLENGKRLYGDDTYARINVAKIKRIEILNGASSALYGTNAIGGVINIITKKNLNRWFVDASYSYGSFNTHKSYINFGQTFKNGLTYSINAFQNYSDNDYWVDTSVKDFETGAINKKKIEHVRRFHDKYHNEAIVAKVGIVNKPWADRLMFGFTWSNMYKDIQTGVRQEVVFGGKYQKGYSLIPSLEYRKQNLFVKGLDATLTANYNKNITHNVDTSTYEYNWRGEMRPLKSPGEQSYQHTRSNNQNWNGTLTLNYRLGKAHTFTFNYVMNAFRRANQSMLYEDSEANAIPKETHKNIGGLSYRLMPNEKWNVSVFGKYYNQYNAGPVATSTAQDEYVKTSNSVNALGYGAAGTYFIGKGFQTKLSYEKAYRLPTNEEMFGDEDLETGDISLKPEKSDNVNINLSYNQTFNRHSVYVEGGLVYRNTQDYIQRSLTNLSGGKYGATYVNHGKVLTKGYNLSVRYGFGEWLSIGGNFTQMNVRDNVKTVDSGSSQESLTYGARMPNLPYQFANSDISFYWNNLLQKGNKLTLTYDNLYMHSFPLYSEALGSESDYVVPTQFSHNLTLSYSLQNGRYNFSVECRNFTNEKLYDNFSLQKAGRAFYGKIRICFGN